MRTPTIKVHARKLACWVRRFFFHKLEELKDDSKSLEMYVEKA